MSYNSDSQVIEFSGEMNDGLYPVIIELKDTTGLSTVTIFEFTV